jgi:alkaline phosphatase D
MPRKLPLSILFSATLALCPLAGFAAEEDPAPPSLVTRIAFGSCLRSSSQPIWNAVLHDKPNAFILLGDNIYADTEDMESMRRKYAALDSVPAFSRLRRTVPLLGIWDDHDYGVNDGGAEYPKRSESREVFLNFMRVPTGSARRAHDGIYDATVWGPPGKRVQVILLDTRFFRSPLKRGEEKGMGYIPDADSSKTMLGESQWVWLEKQLREPAEIRLIASSIQVVAEDNPWEKWGNLPLERKRLFDLIRTTGATGVVFLSGDRHAAELSQSDGNVGYPLYDLTSSPLAGATHQAYPREANRHRVANMDWDVNYGFIEIDWKRNDPRIRLEIRDGEGEIAIRKKLRLSDLRPYAADRLPLMLLGRPLFGFAAREDRYRHSYAAARGRSQLESRP